ncbi:hypothetical protein LMG7141_02332 [Ralstonia condita]|jgi:steroid 5-alpha reductase family enzyme|uniref:Steroid 5-alpha reductase C-terminal domain-containing protein n=1 Tax=Ralstonia condita TaxID=3058600 RepID=A0ABN9IVK3_9RALS|nr:DUF1295 domain-containing protein [Ralstonia sp. LMG 7141]MDE2203238.1 DUF1295 domain-containing protein [Burkholderiaceae bacterium]CAJ0790152.1 hypothetical protein LMG7141_02332 [Ralstonia sp. LMG 7141]
MSPLGVALVALLLLVAVFSAVWAWQLPTQNAGMIDPVWAFSLGVVALLYAWLGTGSIHARVLVGLGGALWGWRLGWHLWRRNAGKPEDARYRKLREEWGAAAPRNMFGFFQMQAVVSMLLSVAFAVPSYRPDAPGIGFVAAAVALWLISVVGEAVADRQLRTFVSDPANRGKTCRAGLWRYSRHPNYFFECVHWLAYVPLAVGAPWAWLTLLPPLLMAWLLVKVSGIPMLEAHMRATRGDYAEYARTTSVLIPWPPRR